MPDLSDIDLREKYPSVLAKAFDVSPPPGWVGIVDRLIQRILDALPPEDRPQLRVTQVKEKFGELRVYHNGDDAVEKLVDEADEEASRTCELCGRPGRKRNTGWVAVLCNDDASKEGVR